MILVKNTDVKCGELPFWIHASHIKRGRQISGEVVTTTLIRKVKLKLTMDVQREE